MDERRRLRIAVDLALTGLRQQCVEPRDVLADVIDRPLARTVEPGANLFGFRIDEKDRRIAQPRRRGVGREPTHRVGRRLLDEALRNGLGNPLARTVGRTAHAFAVRQLLRVGVIGRQSRPPKPQRRRRRRGTPLLHQGENDAVVARPRPKFVRVQEGVLDANAVRTPQRAGKQHQQLRRRVRRRHPARRVIIQRPLPEAKRLARRLRIRRGVLPLRHAMDRRGRDRRAVQRQRQRQRIARRQPRHVNHDGLVRLADRPDNLLRRRRPGRQHIRHHATRVRPHQRNLDGRRHARNRLQPRTGHVGHEERAARADGDRRFGLRLRIVWRRLPVRENVVHRARELLPERLAGRRAVAELARTAREPLQHALARRVGLPVDGDERIFLAALGERLAGLHVGPGRPVAEDHHELPRRHPVRELGLLAGGLQLLALRAARIRPEDDHRNVVLVRVGFGGREVRTPGAARDRGLRPHRIARSTRRQRNRSTHGQRDE